MSERRGSSPAKLVMGGGIDIAQSHSAVVIFIGDRAYKVKKPVDFGFLDFSGVGDREHACKRELELNRRLAPDVYLDVAQVLDGRGDTCDWLLVMRRMPTDRRLAELVTKGADVRSDLRSLARLLASFHSTARRGADIDEAAGLAALRKRWFDNVAGVEPFAGLVIDSGSLREIADLVQRYVDGRRPLLEDRVRRRCAVDGHGDLQAEDIFCMPDGPRVLDCLEFDDNLRYVDVLDDAAFLAMDLERLGAPGAAAEFLAFYQEFSATPTVDTLAHHYVAYRAFVRAKVACLRNAQGVAEAAEEAARLMRITLDHLRRAQPRLVLVGGLPGTGKTTVAGAVADRLAAVVLRTDQIRRELPGNADLRADAGYGKGLYQRDRVHDTYQVMLDRAEELLGRGEHVVLDGSWSSASERESARAVATETHSTLVELRCSAPAAITETRITDRTGDASDATPEIAARMSRHFANWPEAVEIDTSGHPNAAAEQAWSATDPASA